MSTEARSSPLYTWLKSKAGFAGFDPTATKDALAPAIEAIL